MSKDVAQREEEFRARLARFARELSREMFPEGVSEGMTFADLEGSAAAAGDEVSRVVAEDRVRVRAEAEVEQAPATCPECDGPLQEGPRRGRRLATTRGEVAWTETTQRCPRCRRGFSPSRPSVGA